MFNRILVPYDHSPLSKKALETAMNLARQNQEIELDVITAVPIIVATSFYSAWNIESLHEAQLEAAKKIIEEAEQILSGMPNQTKTAVLEGNPPEVIIEYVNKNNIDLIVMGSRGLSGLKEVFLGSISHYVVQKAPCPVFILK